ncbi:PQQ-binding-like beta-propeller repeat protein [Dactylosporangium sp. CA-152071]|uniref:outer membrane protein assembly factor BamB family protein n=1 Tax=Dactylosporangium sp. CA-152071 TaxID=3239933 RepID=UPI003D93F495
MQTDIIAVPKFGMDRTVVDRPLAARLGVAWQARLTGFNRPDIRLDTVGGGALITAAEHGVLSVGADAPRLEPGTDLWPVKVRVCGGSIPGGLLAADTAGTVFRLIPGTEPAPVWHSRRSQYDVSVVALPGGQLVSSENDGGAWGQTELIDDSTGAIVWTSGRTLSVPMPVDDQLVSEGSYKGLTGLKGELVSLDMKTGEERWSRPHALPRGSRLLAVVNGVLWVQVSWRSNRLLGFATEDGRSVGDVALPRESRDTFALDASGTLHIGDEHGWSTVDLTQGLMTADVRFAVPGCGTVYANRTLRSADGRLLFADDRGQIFVVHPDLPQRPELVTTLPSIRTFGIAAGQLVVLSFDGTLTALGTPA